ncbi:flagellar hook-associated protein FlgK [Futiania mangrovi]|uniref:Flagellar hook-associated protein 1 n=1 Tax=Futiania mangrovi TaxID=2959716 RepID=A0A9J6P9Z5_9PROT|nr:flagellar hook-associated protein FlgK [Futiania mangrovii]MCP1336844.1 flagellar hook-associated protein FlgK [Futiania mangrovii]
MSITSALANAASGLRAASRSADVASSNIANAMTEGYSRREVMLAERSVAGRGAGVAVAGVRRAEAQMLSADVRAASARAGEGDARAEALATLSAGIGTADDGGGLSRAMENFRSALSALAETPESVGLQESAAAAARTVTEKFQSASAIVARVRQDADGQIAREVAAVNDGLTRLERIDREIRILSARGEDPSALMDERDRVIDDIAQRVPIRTIRTDQNGVQLMTQEGLALYDGAQARTLSFTPAGAITPGQAFPGGVLSGLTLDGKEVAPGGGSPQAISGGSIAGLFAVRDQITVEAGATLDALAEDLVARFQDPAADPSLAPGQAGLFTDAGSPLGAPVTPGLAGRISVNAAVDPAQGGESWRLRDGVAAAVPGVAGDATQVRRFADALDAPRTLPAAAGIAAPRGAAAAAADIVARLAVSADRAGQQAATERVHAAQLSDARSNKTGVDRDAELQSLIAIEQAYAANAKVVEVMARLVDRLLAM